MASGGGISSDKGDANLENKNLGTYNQE